MALKQKSVNNWHILVHIHWICTDAEHEVFLLIFLGRSSPVDIKVTPKYDGSPDARVEWVFDEVKQDLSHFRVLVEVEGHRISDDRVTKDDKSAMIKRLKLLAVLILIMKVSISAWIFLCT